MDILSIKLKLVNKSDIRFLYNQLKERDPMINISHKKMPTYAEHSQFVLSKPYPKWYIVIHKNKKIGNTYLTKTNEIGIFILKSTKINGIGRIVLEEIMKMNPRSRYLANVSPKNDKSSNFFKKNGFKLIQYTYELTKK
ncbi:MAG: N-acetyltransferase [Thaumarchaeota archaeon]|jgi:predicted acetyltransferase|nr:MAG: N-acetyltransferase [Nitrososphaerota archaeon]